MRNKNNDCNDKCVYKGLYEGSQSSLNEMARSQAEALQRTGRIRNSLILTMKRFFPDEFYQAESNLGSRFTAVDDEIILTFLTHFIENISKNSNTAVLENYFITEIKNYFLLNNIIINSNNLPDILKEISQIINNNTSSIGDSNPANEPIQLTSLGELFANSVMNNSTVIENIPVLDNFSTSKTNEEIENNKLTQEKLHTDIDNLPLDNDNKLFEEINNNFKNKRIKANTPSINITIDENKFEEMNNFANSDKPIFTNDLLFMAGDMETLNAWEKTHRDNIENSNFRFLSSKNRYKQLGSLIINKNSKTSNSTWSIFVEKYRGAILYELAVLFKRIYDDIIDYKIIDNYILIYLKTARGITKLIILLNNIEKNTASEESFKNLLYVSQSENLSILVILAIKADKNIINRVSDMVTGYFVENSIKPRSAIVTAYTWEFADDRGTSAKLIIN